jgi:ArsR family transcriptional regulator
MELRENILSFYRDKHNWKTGTLKDMTAEEARRSILSTADRFLDFLTEAFDPSHIDESIEREAFEYLSDPPKMQKKIFSFLSGLWDSRFKQRWEETKDDLIDFINKTDLSYLRNLTQIQAVSHMTGLDIKEEKLAFALQKEYRLLFIPNKDVGEVYSKMLTQGAFYIFFNPENFEKRRLNAQLNDINELARKLGAVSDGNRLKILKYIASKGEACSQDILKDMGFSQSAVSRHLKMLSDSGILTERRQVSAKFYRLNGEYLHNILHSLTGFLGI